MLPAAHHLLGIVDRAPAKWGTVGVMYILHPHLTTQAYIPRALKTPAQGTAPRLQQRTML